MMVTTYKEDLTTFLNLSPNKVTSDNAAEGFSQPFPSAALNNQQATEWLINRLNSLPSGYTFTSNELFSGLKLLGDKRGRGVILNALRRSGLITVIGLTTENQQGRNNGYAAKWVVV